MTGFIFKKNITAAILVLLAIIITGAVFILRKTTTKDTDAETYILQNMHACFEKTSETKQCDSFLAKDFLNRFPLKTILSVLGHSESADAVFLKNCHTVAHHLGREMYKKTKNLGYTLSQATPECLGGAFHGALEEYFIERKISFSENSSAFNNTNIIANVCGERKDFETKWDYENCHHGLGHALVFFTDNNLPEALALCDAIKEKNTRALCYDGALMQNADTLTDTNSSNVSPSDPRQLCPMLQKQYQEECYSYRIAHQFQRDLKKSIELCSIVPPDYREKCFLLIGTHAPLDTIDSEELKTKCTAINSAEYEIACIRGAVSNLTTRFRQNPAISINFCRALENNQKEICLETFRDALKSIE